MIEPHLLEAYLRRLSRLAAVRVSELNLQSVRDAVEKLPPDDEYFAAWERIEELLEQPQVGWSLLLEIIERAPDAALHIVGAGPLEDFLTAHAAQFQDEISQKLREDSRFRRAFQMAYLFDLPAHLWRHFNAVLAQAGVPREQLRDWSR